MKAKYVGCVHDGWQHTKLFYQYRGHEYIVVRHNNGYMDKSLKEQHEEAQAEIDHRIEHEKDPVPEWNYKGSAAEGFDMFWDSIQ